MSDKRGEGVLRDGIWHTAATFIPVVFAALLSVALARILGAEELGTQTTIAYIQALFAAILVGAWTDLSILAIARAQGAGDQAMVDRLMRLGWRGNFVGGVISAVVLAVIGINSDFAAAWLLCALAALANAATWTYAARIVGAYGWAAVSRQLLFWQSLASVLAVVVVLLGWSITGIFGVYALANICLTLVLRRKAPGVSKGMLRPLPQSFVRLGLSLLVYAILKEVVFRRIEFLFLIKWETATQVAMYSIAFMVTGTVLMIPYAAIGSARPTMTSRIGADQHDLLHSHLEPATRVIATVSAPVAAVVGTLGSAAVVIVYGQNFAPAADLVPIMAISCVFFPVGVMVQSYWTARGEMRPVLGAMILGGIVDVGLCVTLIPGSSILGAAIANTGGQVTFSVAIAVYLWFQAPSRSRRVGRTWLALILGVVIGVGNWWALSVSDGIVAVLAIGTVDALVLLLTQRFIGILSQPDEQWVVELLPAPLNGYFIPFCRWNRVAPRSTR